MFRKLAVLMLVGAASLASAQGQSPYVRYQEPGFFSYEELVALGQSGPLAPELQEKLDTLTTTPFVNNEAYYRGAKPHHPVVHHLGASLRVVMWNIERGVHLDEIILMFNDREGFIRKVATERLEASTDEELPPELLAELATDASQNYAMLRAQVAAMQTADVLILNEVDWGMPRSEYREVAKQLGEALDMNWTWGLEFVEVDAKVLGTETFESVTDETERQKLIEASTPDKARLKAFHGSAILSRYPIRSAELIPFTEGYDWFSGEENLPIPEKVVRGLAGVFGDPLYREMRRGGRMALYAELDVPDLPEGRVTVVTPHLENRAKPKVRHAQMQQVLEHIRGVEHPVVVAGDLNTTGGDYSPRSFTNILETVFMSQDWTPELGAVFLSPFGLGYSALHFGTQVTHNQSDPTVQTIPILAPNYEQPLFAMIQDFRFDDGTSFDLRGDPLRTHDGVHTGKLANSNDRADKGFAPTFDTGTMGFLGQFKLDWIFVKSSITDPFDTDQTYRFAPHGSWVMKLLNVAPVERLSDHYPMVVTLPFEEPILPDETSGLTNVRRMPHNMPDWARDEQRRLAAERERERKRADAKRTADLSQIALGSYACGEYLTLLDEAPSIAGVRDIWALGFHYGESGLDETWPTLTYDKVLRFTERLQTLCEQNPDELWFDIVRGLPPERARGATITFFDLRPGQYTCQQHLDLAAAESHLANNRAVFAHGYDAVHRGVGDIPVPPPVTAHALFAYSESILARCRTSPDELWIRVVRHDGVHEQTAALELTWDEIANASFTGLVSGPATLQNGVHASGNRRVELVRDFRRPTYLFGHRFDESLVLLTEREDGRPGTRSYLAIVTKVDGVATNLQTALVGDHVQVIDGRGGDDGIELDVVQTGPDDEDCCPSLKLIRKWTLVRSHLREQEPVFMGTLSLSDLEGVEWVLSHFDRDERVPAPTVTLSVTEGHLAGHGGCNRYFAEAVDGDAPGALGLGPVGATRMACPGAAEQVETRYLRLLEGVTRFGFQDGKLALTTSDGNTARTMLFARGR